MRITQNTKAIARQAGMTTAEVNELARDLGIKMRFRSDNSHWEIIDRNDARAFIGHLALLDEN